MTKEREPLAWRTRPPAQLSAAFVRELNGFHGAGLGEARRQRIWQSLERELSAKPAQHLGAKTALNVLGLGAVALVLVVELLGHSARDARLEQPKPALRAATSLPPAAAEVTEPKFDGEHDASPLPAAEIPASSTALPSKSVLVPQRQSARAPVAKASSRAQGAPAGELQLLLRARRLVRSAPARALALAEQHSSSYPQGSLSEEREVLAIDALERIGRHAQARERARLFAARYHGSAHSQRVATLVSHP